MILEIFKNSKYDFRMFKFQELFARCKWAIICMTFEQSCGLWYKYFKELVATSKKKFYEKNQNVQKGHICGWVLC